MNFLKIITPDGVENSYELVGNVISIGGNKDNSIIINDPEVAPCHARLIWNGAAFMIERISPEWLLFVNGSEVDGMVRLNPGEIISLGNSIAIFSPEDLIGNEIEKRTAGRKIRVGKKLKKLEPKYKDLTLQEKEIKSHFNTSIFSSVFGTVGLIGCTFWIGLIFIPISFYYANCALESTRSSDLSDDQKEFYFKRAKVAKIVAWISLGVSFGALIIGVALKILAP